MAVGFDVGVWPAGANLPQVPETSLRPIIDPRSPRWVAVIPTMTQPTLIAAAVFLVVFSSALLVSIVVGLAFGALPSIALIVALTAAAAFGAHHASEHVLTRPNWRLHGVTIRGESFKLLEDIDARFAYAEKHIRTLPTGIRWSEIADDVRQLLWEAAQQAVEVSRLDDETHELRYASPGTPQAALRADLVERRDEHLHLMKAVQWEAETLARVAGNAAAAARVALARVGTLARLDRVTPSREALVAAASLAEARARLELLAEVWSDLDDSGAIAAEKLRHEDQRQLPPKKSRNDPDNG